MEPHASTNKLTNGSFFKLMIPTGGELCKMMSYDLHYSHVMIKQ